MTSTAYVIFYYEADKVFSKLFEMPECFSISEAEEQAAVIARNFINSYKTTEFIRTDDSLWVRAGAIHSFLVKNVFYTKNGSLRQYNLKGKYHYESKE